MLCPALFRRNELVATPVPYAGRTKELAATAVLYNPRTNAPPSPAKSVSIPSLQLALVGAMPICWVFSRLPLLALRSDDWYPAGKSEIGRSAAASCIPVNCAGAGAGAGVVARADVGVGVAVGAGACVTCPAGLAAMIVAAPATPTVPTIPAVTAAFTALTCPCGRWRRSRIRCTAVPCTAAGPPVGHSAASSSAARSEEH